jgi:hypothetical protein
MRVAALCAEPDDRDAVRRVLDRALALERALWTGEPAPAADGELGPIETAAHIEELTRAILKDAACGHLGGDLRATADEILLADGFAVGDGSEVQRGATAEWAMGDPDELEHDWAGEDEAPDLDEEPPEPEELEDVPLFEPMGFRPAAEVEYAVDEKVPEPTRRITVHRPGFIEPEEEQMTAYATAATYEEIETHDSPTTVIEAVAPPSVEARPVSERVNALLAEHRAEREAAADRVAYLFPRPEPCEWDVPEVGYDRRRRADVSAQAS